MVSGSIAAFKACQVVSQLVQRGYEVQVVATANALKFVGEATWEGLTGRPVFSDLWQSSRAMDHIALAKWAELSVLCPASATTMARVANGLADNAVAALLLIRRDTHIFPAMNTQMYLAPQTQAHFMRLREYGYTIHPTADGNLACGENGPGRLLEPDQILQRLAPKESCGQLLVTGGATREPLDGIRFLSNVSTGRTAAQLVGLLSAQGWRVTFLHGEGAEQTPHAERAIRFSSCEDLDTHLRRELDQTSYAGVIHCAAVSDYAVADIDGLRPDLSAKMESRERLNHVVHLRANPKLLPRLKSYSRNRDLRVVGFKLTLNQNDVDLDRIARTLLSPDVDAIVANDWSRLKSGSGVHPGLWIPRDGDRQNFNDLNQLASHLNAFFSKTQKSEVQHDSLS